MKGGEACDYFDKIEIADRLQIPLTLRLTCGGHVIAWSRLIAELYSDFVEEVRGKIRFIRPCYRIDILIHGESTEVFEIF